MSDPKVADNSEGELSPATSHLDEDTADSARTTVTRRSVSKPSGSKKKKSKYDLLEEKWNSKFENFDKAMDDKLDKFFDEMSSSLMQSQRLASQPSGSEIQSQRRFSPERGSQSPVINENMSQRQLSDTDSDHNDESDREDSVSIRVGAKERADLNESDDDTKSIDENLSEKTKKCLFDLFGNDAVTKKSESKKGIKLDDSQKQVLLGSWRAENPNSITAFAEENKELFPVDTETEKFLEVPTLDDMIERCLINKHGRRAAFSKSGKSLYTQPYKMVEKLAYRGQQAAYLGIIMQMYMQQSLGSLIETLSEETVNIDRAIKQVRDTFAISTKGLDQFGRAGAFHHIIRRQLAMTDTSLYTLEDNRDISDLPLSSNGVFGEKLESTLKSNKEKKKTLDDLLPKFDKDRKRKHKLDTESTGASSAKKAFSDKDKTAEGQQVTNSAFRIPKIQRNTGYERKNRPQGQLSQPGQSKKPPTRGSHRGGRKQ